MNTEKIAILTDSGADIPAEYIDKYPIYIIPLHVIFPERDYLSGIDITDEAVYERVKEGTIPKTSMPSFYEVQETFQKIKDDGYEKVIAITISALLSGTNNLFHLVAEEFQDELDIFIVNSKNISMGVGLIAIECGRHIEAGKPWLFVKKACVRAVRLSKVHFTLATLEYLKKGGRIGAVSAGVGNVLGLKPIISCDDNGAYKVTEMVRGWDKSIRKTIDVTATLAAKCSHYSICLMYGENTPEIDRYRETCPLIFERADLYMEQKISPALGVHTGPECFGFAILPEVYKDPDAQKASEEA